MADVLVYTGTEWLSLRGPAGADGQPGADGAKGDVGETGPAGADGAAGEAGPKGDPGDQGVPGEKGDKGDAGSGVSIVGPLTEWPITVPVEAGDMFIVSDPVPVGTPASATGPALPGDGIVYDGTTYSNVGPVRGPIGPQGPAGADGDDGADGAKGDPGEKGEAGADGADGVSQEVYEGPTEPVGAAKGAIWFQVP
jgi:trimeric autotransporter adhesin